MPCLEIAHQLILTFLCDYYLVLCRLKSTSRVIHVFQVVGCLLPCLILFITDENLSLYFFLLGILGGWPLVGIASNTTWSINDESHLMEKLYGSIAFFSSTVQADPRNTSQNVYCVRHSSSAAG